MSPSYTVTVILLAGGTGQRMGSPIPKQYLTLDSKAIARHSFDSFTILPEVVEIIVVCEEEYREVFDCSEREITLLFASPGKRRQDSMANGFRAMSSNSDLVCIHDAARPFVTPDMIKEVFEEAMNEGAATAALPLKYTVKQADIDGFVTMTPDRSMLWEIQTPQAIKPHLLEEGLAFAESKGVTVTDDVSLVELIGSPVKLVHGNESNIKITTPQDIQHAEAILSFHQEAYLQV